MARNAWSGYRVVSTAAIVARPFPRSPESSTSAANSTSRHHFARPAAIASPSATRAAAPDASWSLLSVRCCSSRGSRIISGPTFLEEGDCTCRCCRPRPAHYRQSGMPTAYGSAEVPESSVDNCKPIMQKRETICAEGRAPADRHPAVVVSFLVATLSERTFQLFPVRIGESTAPREQSHFAYLAQHQSAYQYVGTLLVEVTVEQQDVHLSFLHGFFEGSQTELVASFDGIPPVTDLACIWEVSRVFTFYTISISDRGPEQLWPYRWCRKLLDRYPGGDTGLWLQ